MGKIKLLKLKTSANVVCTIPASTGEFVNVHIPRISSLPQYVRSHTVAPQATYVWGYRSLTVGINN